MSLCPQEGGGLEEGLVCLYALIALLIPPINGFGDDALAVANVAIQQSPVYRYMRGFSAHAAE